MFQVLDVRVDRRGLHGEQGAFQPALSGPAPAPAGLVWKAAFGFFPKPRSDRGLRAVASRFSPLTRLSLTSPGLLCASKYPKFAQLIQ